MKYIRKWFFPETDKYTNYEIDSSNLRNIYYVSLVVSCVQFVALAVYIISHFSEITSQSVIESMLSVASSIVIFLIALPVTGRMRKKPAFVAAHHPLVNTVAILYCVIFLIWGMLASMRVYARDHQIITFYIVELCVLLFVKFKPWVSTVIILSSYCSYFIFLELFIKPGMINPYNYSMLALLSVAGSITNYHLTIGNVEKKNKIELLNLSLQRIASHDSLTRLRNRHALNHDLASCIRTELCVAMGDINRFKQINDRFGHQTGDVILRHVADVLLAVFSEECVYRYGGDEFLIIMRDTSAEEFEKRIESFNERLSKYRIQDSDQSISCSIGYVKGKAENAEGIIRMISNADEKLYEQKQTLIPTK